MAVAVCGGYAYVADEDSGLRVISVTDPTNPVEVGSCCVPDRTWFVTLSGGYAYVAGHYMGMRVISIADPARPMEVGYFGSTGQVSGVAVSGSFAHVAAGMAGLRIVSVADPASPVEVGYYQTGTAHSVCALGDYAYVLDYLGGLQILEFYGAGVEDTPGAEVRTRDFCPTVVRGVLVLNGLGTRSELSDNSVMSRAALLDIGGRQVMDLKPGANDISHLSPGVYFVREQGGERRERSTVGCKPPAVAKVVIAR
jgi:hypothetical protein